MRTLPYFVVLCFPLLSGNFLVFLPSFKTFVGQVHLDCPSRTITFPFNQIEHRTHFLLLTSSSISRSLDCCLNCALNGGSRLPRRGSLGGVLGGRLLAFRTRIRAWFMTASNSSRFALSESSDSACRQHALARERLWSQPTS